MIRGDGRDNRKAELEHGDGKDMFHDEKSCLLAVGDGNCIEKPALQRVAFYSAVPLPLRRFCGRNHQPFPVS